MAEKSAQEKLLYRDVLKYLTERSYRAEAEKQWKRMIRRKAKDFTVNDGGGQFGRDKTLQKICSRFYWQDMTNGRERTCI
eukprot:Em0037g17a